MTTSPQLDNFQFKENRMHNFIFLQGFLAREDKRKCHSDLPVEFIYTETPLFKLKTFSFN